MQFLAGTTSDLSRQVVHELARYRFRVFVERLGWQLPCEPGIEFDGFDRPDTVYVMARSEPGQIVGCARLLPTTAPYLLSHVFPELLKGCALPCSPQVWELSRFAAMDLEDDATSNFGITSSSAAVALLRASMRVAYERGASELVTVSPLGIERLLRRAGFEARRFGPAMLIGEHWLFACRIAVTTKDAASAGHRRPKLDPLSSLVDVTT